MQLYQYLSLIQVVIVSPIHAYFDHGHGGRLEKHMDVDINFVERMLLVAESGLDIRADDQVRAALTAIRDELTDSDEDVSKFVS